MTDDPANWPLIPRGTAFEEHVVGRVFEHHWGRTIHASDNTLFSTQTLAFNPIHFNRAAAQAAGHRDEVINPLLVFSVVFGLSVEDLSEVGGPFLGANSIEYVRDVYPGETLYASSTVLDARVSKTRPDTGIVTWHTVGRDTTGSPVIEFDRTNLVRRSGETQNVLTAPDGYAEDFEVGARFRHARTRTVTDIDLNGLTLLVMNSAPGHFSQQAMAGTSFGERINFGGLTLALTVGLATQDTTGQAVRELGLDEIHFPTPVRHGDTIGAATEVAAVELLDDGDSIVTFRHLGINQQGEIVCRTTRRVQVRSRASTTAEPTVRATQTSTEG